MFRYLTSYRCYTLAKVGFGLAYLWYIVDFFRVHFAIWHGGLGLLLARSAAPVFSGDADLDSLLRPLASFCDREVVVWFLLLTSPLVVGLYLWGRHRWLQCAVGFWMSATLIAMTALIDFFHSTADVWLNLSLLLYGIAALISSNTEWEAFESGFSFSRWKQDPVLPSTYARLIVLLQFSVYFFAGINKLHDGWVPWTTGTAVQNLMAYDNSVHEFARGIYVPYWLSFLLCYVTLFQRLVVPFGFFFKRYRLWSVLILGSMHIGYAILMYVNLFPLMGLASLLLVLPPRASPAPQPSSRRAQKKLARLQETYRSTLVQTAVIWIFGFCLITDCLRLTFDHATPLESTLMLAPNWRMFANGGSTPNGEWKILLNTPGGQIDATHLSLQSLPQSWRDRFYLNMVYANLLTGQVTPGSFVDTLVDATEMSYQARQRRQGHDPTIVGAQFQIAVKGQNYTFPVAGNPPRATQP